MTSKTADQLKAFLSGAAQADLLVRTRLDEIAAIKERYALSKDISPQAAERIVERLAAAEAAVNRDIDRYFDKKEEIRELISHLPTNQMQAIMTRYYILEEPWEKVAENCFVSERCVYNLHNKAIAAILSYLTEQAG